VILFANLTRSARFATMITELTGQDLPQWMAAAREAGLPGITSFAKGLEQDLDAVSSGSTCTGTGRHSAGWSR
jgi:hypothetical protein